MQKNVLCGAQFKVTLSEKSNDGGNKKQLDPKKALAQLFIDDIAEFQKLKEGKEVDEAKRLKPIYPEKKYKLTHLYYQEPDYKQARFTYYYLKRGERVDCSITKFEREKYGMVYFNLDMSGEDPTLDIFSMSEYSTEEIIRNMLCAFADMVEKQMGDKGYNIQIDNVEEAMERGKVDITTIKTMINQPGPIMEKIYSKNAN